MTATDPSASRGDIYRPSRGHDPASTIITTELQPIGQWPSWQDDPDRLSERVLKGLRDGYPPHHGPGWAWWAIRSWVGGRVRTDLLRSVLDTLLAERLVIEIWQHPGKGGPLLHRFVLVEDWETVDANHLVRVKGHVSVLDHLGVNTLHEVR